MLLKDFWVEKVYVIAYKTEKNRFYFHNENRLFDGFVYFTKGNGFFVNENAEKISISKNSFILLKKGQKYSFIFEEDCEYYTVAYDLGENEQSVGVSVFNLPCVNNNASNLDYLISNLLTLENGDKVDKMQLIRKNVYDIIKTLNYNVSLSENNLCDENIENALKFIQLHYRDRFTTDELARFCSLSQSYVRGLFKKATGMTITEYAEKLRITQAKYMLESGFFEIKEIGEYLGYVDVYHFTKRFTKEAGVSPAKYKALLQRSSN